MPRWAAVVSIDRVRKAQGVSISDAVLAHLDELYRFALRLTRDAGRATELVHDTVLRALEQQNTPIREPRAWLFQTLYHIFVSQYRARLYRSKTHGEDSFADEAHWASAANPLPDLMAVEDVRTAVEHLSEEFRAVVWLSDAEQFSLREIAEILACPLGTIASRLARGRQQLRTLLSIYGPREGK